MIFRLCVRHFLVLLTVVSCSICLGSKAQAFETEAQAAILVDMETGQVLFEKNPDLQLPPASMSKLMTTYMVLEQIKQAA